MADILVIHCHHARPAENLIFDDDAARQIAAALQRHKVADADITLDVHVRTDNAIRADDGLIADQYEIADPRVRANLCVVGNNAMMAEQEHWITVAVRFGETRQANMDSIEA